MRWSRRRCTSRDRTVKTRCLKGVLAPAADQQRSQKGALHPLPQPRAPSETRAPSHEPAEVSHNPLLSECTLRVGLAYDGNESGCVSFRTDLLQPSLEHEYGPEMILPAVPVLKVLDPLFSDWLYREKPAFHKPLFRK
jgi:hypothetical protein